MPTLEQTTIPAQTRQMKTTEAVSSQTMDLSIWKAISWRQSSLRIQSKRTSDTEEWHPSASFLTDRRIETCVS